MLQLLRQATDSTDFWSWLFARINENEGIFAAVAALVAVVAVAVTVYIENRNMKTKGLNLVFEKLNDPQKRIARRNILSTYAIYLDKHSLPTKYTISNFKDLLYDIDMADYCPTIKGDLETVKSDFEEIAVMEKHGMINEKAYFDAYYGSMLRCFPALYGHILKSRRTSGSEHFTVYYEKQCYRAIRYWQKNHDCSTMNYHVDIDYGKLDWTPRSDMPPPKREKTS